LLIAPYIIFCHLLMLQNFCHRNVLLFQRKNMQGTPCSLYDRQHIHSIYHACCNYKYMGISYFYYVHMPLFIPPF
jgi:hypothetical protein